MTRVLKRWSSFATKTFILLETKVKKIGEYAHAHSQLSSSDPLTMNMTQQREIIAIRKATDVSERNLRALALIYPKEVIYTIEWYQSNRTTIQLIHRIKK